MRVRARVAMHVHLAVRAAAIVTTVRKEIVRRAVPDLEHATLGAERDPIREE